MGQTKDVKSAASVEKKLCGVSAAAGGQSSRELHDRGDINMFNVYVHWPSVWGWEGCGTSNI